MKLPQHLIDGIKAVDKYVEENYPRGKIMRWKSGKFKGRRCIITGSTYDEWDYTISAVVDTERKDLTGWLLDNSFQARIYRVIEDNFEEL